MWQICGSGWRIKENVRDVTERTILTDMRTRQTSITTWTLWRRMQETARWWQTWLRTESIHRKNLKAITKKCSRRSIRWIIFRAKRTWSWRPHSSRRSHRSTDMERRTITRVGISQTVHGERSAPPSLRIWILRRWTIFGIISWRSDRDIGSILEVWTMSAWIISGHIRSTECAMQAGTCLTLTEERRMPRHLEETDTNSADCTDTATVL